LGKKKALTIIIGGDMEKDWDNLLSNKQTKQPASVLYVESFEQLNKLLSPMRLDLFNYLISAQGELKPKSVSQIAEMLNRHQEAISRDIGQLAALKLVILKKIKQAVYAYPNYDSINIRTGKVKG